MYTQLTWQSGQDDTNTVGHKNTPKFFFTITWKKGYPILLIFGTRIHDTTGHQMVV